MAQLIVELSDEALAHAEECAKTLGYPNAAAWTLEWLGNSAKQVEKNRKQKSVDALSRRIDADMDELYGVNKGI